MRRRRSRPFIIEVNTTTGKVCERFATYEQAKERIDRVPEDTLLGIPFIFQELADGSYRLVRDDGKPLQWHRLMDESVASDAPLPLSEEAPTGDRTIRATVAQHDERRGSSPP